MKSKNSAFGLTGILAVAIFILVPAGRSSGGLVEGFEAGLTPGSTIGDASIQTPNYFGINPTQGTHELLLTNINSLAGHGPGNPVSTVNAEGTVNVANFLGVATSQIRNTKPGAPASATGQEGSAFKLNLGFLTAGSVITFDYNFLTNDLSGARDFGFVTLTGMAGNTPTFADTLDAITAFGGGSPFNFQTGYQTYTINITTAGNYTLGIGIMDATNTDGRSGLLIDNIAVVPEPSTIGLGIAGAALLVALRRRIKKTPL